jgi:hypothetical protein
VDEQRLAEIEQRLQATTPGPWRHGSLSEARFPDHPRTEVIAEEEGVPEGFPAIEGLAGCRVVHIFTVIQPYQHATVEHEDERAEHTEWLCRCEADARFFAHARQDLIDLLAEVRRGRASAAR